MLNLLVLKMSKFAMKSLILLLTFCDLHVLILKEFILNIIRNLFLFYILSFTKNKLKETKNIKKLRK